MQSGIRGRTMRGTDNHDPYIALLTRLLLLTVRDARQTFNIQLRGEAWRFLWDVAPSIAERLTMEEGLTPMQTMNQTPMTLAEAESAIRQWQEQLQKNDE